MTTYNYNAGGFSSLVNGLPVREYAPGDAITVELVGDDTTMQQGLGGAVVVSRQPNDIVDITLNVMQGSADNEFLGDLFTTILTAGRGSLSFVLMDTHGTSLVVVPQAVPKKRPSLPVGLDAGTITYMLHGQATVFKIGGNEFA